MGLIDRYGSGIKRVRQLFLNHGLPEPTFKMIQDGFFVRIHTSPYLVEEKVEAGENVTENVTENRGFQILDLMRKSPSITTEQVAKILKVTKRTIIRDIEKLKNNNQIEYIGPAKGGYWKVLIGG